MPQQNSAGRKPPGIAEYLFAELRQGLQDIRQKLVEEGWFGRVVSAAPVVELSERPIDHAEAAPDRVTPEYRPSFDELWRPRDPLAPGAERDPGMDFDR